MEKFAIWKDKEVIGYIDLTEEQRAVLNNTKGINVYFGFDKITRPDMYVQEGKETYTWDKLYERAEGAACGEPELKAKDNARWELTQIIKEQTGMDVDKCEIPEEAIENFLKRSEKKYLFDVDGNLMT